MMKFLRWIQNKGNGKFEAKGGKKKIGKTFYTEKNWGSWPTFIAKSMDACIIIIATYIAACVLSINCWVTTYNCMYVV